MSTEQIRKTLRAYQRAVTAEPTNVDLRQKLAGYLAALGYTRQAAQELELCAKLLAARGELIGAISCGKRLLKLDPGRTDILLFLTRHYAQLAGSASAVARVSRPEPVAPDLDRRVDRDRTPPVPSRALELDTASGVHEHSEPPAATSPRTATHEATTRVVRMPLRDPGLESIELTVVSLGDDDGRDLLLTGLELGAGHDALHETAATADEDAPGGDDAPEQSDAASAPPHLVRIEIPNTVPLDIRPAELPGIPLFSSLEPAAFMDLLESLEHRTLSAGTVLDSRDAAIDGDDGDAAIKILVQGKLRAWWRRPDGSRVELGPIEPGNLFGEFEVLTGEDHDHMQVEVDEDCELLVVPRKRLDALCEEHPRIRQRLESLHHKRLVRDFLAASDLFDSLGVTDRELLARRLRPRALRRGEWLGRRGEPTEGLYLVRDGQLESLDPDGARLAVLGPGQFFGLHSLRNGSIFLTGLRALAATTLLVLPAADLELFLEAHAEARDAFEAIAASEPPAPP